MSGRRPRKAVPVECAGRIGAVDVGAAAPRGSLWRPGFCGNDDDGSDVGDAAMVAVVGSSPACLRFCLGLLVAVESKLRRRGPVVYDDWLHVTRSAIFCGASLRLILFVCVLRQSRSCVVWPQVDMLSIRVGFALCVSVFKSGARPLLFRFSPGFP
jgi:hypothetical protein